MVTALAALARVQFPVPMIHKPMFVSDSWELTTHVHIHTCTETLIKYILKGKGRLSENVNHISIKLLRKATK